MVFEPQEVQIMPITALHSVHKLQLTRVPPQFLHDSSGNSFRIHF